MGQSQSISDSQIAAQWEWKESTDPFSPAEKALWKPYEPLENFLIERAHFNHQNEVDIGDYIVSIKDMFQRKKSDAAKQRPIRRVEEMNQNKEENSRTERYFGAETPRTFTKVFGDLEAYLKFFENRGPGIKEFGRILAEIETSEDIDRLNKMIMPCLVACIKNESKKIPKIKEKEVFIKHSRYENRLLLLFKSPVTSIEQFYANVLKAYTMEGFLYKKLNFYLRDEDWIQLDCLLPYVHCLCRAFFRPELSSTQENPSPAGSQQNDKMILYRGTHFDEAALVLYDPNITKNFSWNSMTSTSTNPAVAEKFMFRSIDLKKVPVMFKIEVPTNAQRLKSAIWIDMKPFTAIKNEDEVVLAPGSGFEILEVSRKHHSQVVEIRLRLLMDVERLMNQGQILHGTMQSKMMRDDMMKIADLKGRELLEAIAHLKGNQLIQIIEFCDCAFNEKVSTNFAEILKTMPKLNKMVFAPLSSIGDEYFRAICHQLRKIKLSTLEISGEFVENNDIDREDFAKAIGFLTSLRFFSLTFGNDNSTNSFDFQTLCSKGLKNLTLLTYLDLKVTGYERITNQVLEIFSFQVLQNMTSLKSLSLSFSSCERISDQGLNTLYSQGLQFLPLLTSLKLNFQSSYELTGKNVDASCFKKLKNLTTLDLSFVQCRGIIDIGLSNLGSKGFKSLPLLRDLDLDFRGCPQITNEAVEDLCNQGLKKLHSNILIKLDEIECIRALDDSLDRTPEFIHCFFIKKPKKV